jgi:putative salt-induced outer membrane protein YdiY
MQRVIPSIIVISAIISALSGAVTGRADNAPPASVSANGDVVKDWNGSIALGLAVTQGNSKTLTANGALDLMKEWKSDQWRFGADGQYGVNNFGAKTNEVINAENVHGFVDYKHLFTERFFGDVRADGWHDDVADLQNREVVGPALGYYFIKTDASRLSGEVGGSYEHQRQASQDSNFFVVHVGERGEHDWGKQAKVWEEVSYLPKVDDLSVYLLISEVGAEAAINTHFSLRVVFQDRYNSTPATGRVPNDLAILASLVYKFGVTK